MFAGAAALKNRMPSGPISTSPLPVDPSGATVPRSCTYGAPLTSVQRAPVEARTKMYHTSLGANWVEPSTNPSEPARSDLKSATAGVGSTPRLR